MEDLSTEYLTADDRDAKYRRAAAHRSLLCRKVPARFLDTVMHLGFLQKHIWGALTRLQHVMQGKNTSKSKQKYDFDDLSTDDLLHPGDEGRLVRGSNIFSCGWLELPCAYLHAKESPCSDLLSLL